MISLKILGPPLALLRRRAARRWWIEERGRTDEPVADLSDGPDRQTQAEGVGKVISRRYRIEIAAPEVTADQVISRLLRDPNAHAPQDYAIFDQSITHTGQRLAIELAGPWDGPVEVRDISGTSLLLGTRDGHMEAGWIRFAATDLTAGGAGQRVRFEILSAATAGDPAFWTLHVPARIGQWVQADMWCRVLEESARLAGDDAPAPVRITTLTHG